MKTGGLKTILLRLIQGERRKAKRFFTSGTLYIEYLSLLSKQNGAAEGKDISTRGVRFACDEAIPVETRLELTLHFSPFCEKAEMVRIRSSVVRCYREASQMHYRVACAFDKEEDKTRDEVASFISWVKSRK